MKPSVCGPNTWCQDNGQEGLCSLLQIIHKESTSCWVVPRMEQKHFSLSCRVFRTHPVMIQSRNKGFRFCDSWLSFILSTSNQLDPLLARRGPVRPTCLSGLTVRFIYFFKRTCDNPERERTFLGLTATSEPKLDSSASFTSDSPSLLSTSSSLTMGPLSQMGVWKSSSGSGG